MWMAWTYLKVLIWRWTVDHLQEERSIKSLSIVWRKLGEKNQDPKQPRQCLTSVLRDKPQRKSSALPCPPEKQNWSKHDLLPAVAMLEPHIMLFTSKTQRCRNSVNFTKATAKRKQKGALFRLLFFRRLKNGFSRACLTVGVYCVESYQERLYER